MLTPVENFIKKYGKEIKKVQTYKGEVYSEKLKKEVARLCTLKTVSRYMIVKQAGLPATLVRNWDLKYNHGLKPDGEEISE